MATRKRNRGGVYAPEPKAAAEPEITILDYARIAEQNGLNYLTPNWEATLKAFYALPLTDEDIEILCRVTLRSHSYWSGRREGKAKPGVVPFRELWARVGRRGQKTTTTSLICLYEATQGGHEYGLAKGESGRITVISKDKDGSALLAGFMKDMYGAALGIEMQRTSVGGVDAREMLDIEGSRFNVAITPPNKRATRGPASPVIVCDEFAHIGTEEDDSANSDKAILAAAKPSMAQFKHTSKLIVISSPLGEKGLHYKTVEANLRDELKDHTLANYRSDRVLAVQGPSWEWGDISKEETHELERDPEEHAREFGAIPSGTEGVAFPKDDVIKSFGPKPGVWEFGRPFMLIDASSSSNTFACMIGVCGTPTKERRALKIRKPDGSVIVQRDARGEIVFEPQAKQPIVRLMNIFGFTGEEMKRLGTDEVVKQIAEEAKASNVEFIFGDQYGAGFLAPLLATHGCALRFFNNSATSKHEAVLTIRWLMRENYLSVVNHEKALDDFKNYPKRISGGRFLYGFPATSGHHSDYASALMCLGSALNGISLGGGVEGQDGNGNVYRIDKAPTRHGVGRANWTPKSAWGQPSETA